MLATRGQTKLETTRAILEELLKHGGDIDKAAAEIDEVYNSVKWCPYEAMYQCHDHQNCRSCDYMLRWQMRQAKIREGR